MTIFDSLRYPIINWSQVVDTWFDIPEPIRIKYGEWNAVQGQLLPHGYDKDTHQAHCMQKIRQLILEYEE